MALNLVKLCVGCESITDLTDWIAESAALRRKRRVPDEQVHVTRMMPKRVDDILDGGSLYWVIKGQIACRQSILDLRAVTDADGIGRCAIVLDQTVIRETLARHDQRLLEHDSVLQEVVERMLVFANVKPGDVLYDLGAGDVAEQLERLPVASTYRQLARRLLVVNRADETVLGENPHVASVLLGQ